MLIEAQKKKGLANLNMIRRSSVAGSTNMVPNEFYGMTTDYKGEAMMSMFPKKIVDTNPPVIPFY